MPTIYNVLYFILGAGTFYLYTWLKDWYTEMNDVLKENERMEEELLEVKELLKYVEETK